ncbi:MAG: hypothetical protein R2731_05570 [Nocardioides sp.]
MNTNHSIRPKLVSLASVSALALTAFAMGHQGAAQTAPAAGGSGDNLTLVSAVPHKSGLTKGDAVHYTLPDIPATSGFTVKFPKLPKGKYLMTYEVVAGTDNGGAMLCAVDRQNGPAQAVDYGSPFASFATASSADIVDLGQGWARLRCQPNGGSTIDPDPDGSAVSGISFVRLGKVKNKTAGVVSSKAPAKSAGSSSGR